MASSIIGNNDAGTPGSTVSYPYTYNMCRVADGYPNCSMPVTEQKMALTMKVRCASNINPSSGLPYTVYWKGGVWDEDGNLLGYTNVISTSDTTLQWRSLTFIVRPRIKVWMSEIWIGVSLTTGALGASGGIAQLANFQSALDVPPCSDPDIDICYWAGGYIDMTYVEAGEWIEITENFGSIAGALPPTSSTWNNPYWRYAIYLDLIDSPAIDELNDVDYDGGDVNQFIDVDYLSHARINDV